MVSDTEPRYRLVDSNGNVVGSLFAEADGTLKLQEGTSGSDNELAFGTDGSLSVDQINIASAGSVGGVLSQAVEHGKVLADDGKLYDSVQTAENNATDWLFIGPGTFNESVTISTSGLDVSGSGRLGTVIDGGTTGHGIEITGNQVTVRDLSAQTTSGQGNNYDGILVTANRVILDRVSVPDSDRDGIRLDGNRSNVYGSEVRGVDGNQCTVTANSTGSVIDGNLEITVTDNGTSTVVGDNG